MAHFSWRLIPVILAAAFGTGGLGILSARADSDRSRLFAAAEHYRESVIAFERLVDRNSHLSRQQERAADALEDATARLLSAARDPGRIDRLWPAWRDVMRLHRQTEAVVFAKPNFPGRAALAGQWAEASGIQRQLAREIDFVLGQFGAGVGGPWYGPGHYLPPIYQPPYVQPPIYYYPPPIFLPSDPLQNSFEGGNHPSQWNPNRGFSGSPSWTETPSGTFRSRVPRATVPANP